MKITAYPLCFPPQRVRTDADRRLSAAFRDHGQSVGMSCATNRLSDQLRLLGLDVNDWTLSTNVPLRRDGWPHAKPGLLMDPGAAVYFDLDGQGMEMACDKWDRVEDNIAAIAGHIEAVRRQERLGVATVKQSLSGLAALPAPMTAPRHWTEVLDLPVGASTSEISSRFRQLAKRHHPDVPGGDAALMSTISEATDVALAEASS